MKRFFILSAVVVALIIVLVLQATKSSAAHVVLPSVLASSPTDRTRVRVGGRVADKPIVYQMNPTFLLTFYLRDPENPDGPSVFVEYPSVRPDMFSVGRDVIVDGDLVGGTLKATNLLTQCPSKYEPPKPSQSETGQSAPSTSSTTTL